MTQQEAARRYVQASMASGYTGLPDEHREAHEGTMRDLERRFPGVRDRALAGASSDFDKPLSAGEREHQAHLRSEEGLQHADVLRMRRELRGAPSSNRSTRRGGRRAAVRAGAAGGRAFARAQRQVLSSSGVQDTGSLLLQALGVAIGLSLLYLALSPAGSKGFSTLLNGIAKFVRLLTGPFDPLNPKGTPSSSKPTAAEEHPEPGGPNSLAGGPVKATPQQRAKLGPAFGPGPGIGTPITPIGVTP